VVDSHSLSGFIGSSQRDIKAPMKMRSSILRQGRLRREQPGLIRQALSLG
jgi:hypothetical protein